MKKISLFLVITSLTLFAASNTTFEGCKELKLSEAKSIISCPSGDYEVTFGLNRDKRDLIEAPNIVKIGDFGYAIQLTAGKLYRKSLVGTPAWMAPEIIKRE